MPLGWLVTESQLSQGSETATQSMPHQARMRFDSTQFAIT